MKDLIKKAIEQCIPVDVYFHYTDENNKPACELEYQRFMFTEIDEEINQFWGYTFEMATLPTSQKILTSGYIGAICKLESEDLEIGDSLGNNL